MRLVDLEPEPRRPAVARFSQAGLSSARTILLAGGSWVEPARPQVEQALGYRDGRALGDGERLNRRRFVALIA